MIDANDVDGPGVAGAATMSSHERVAPTRSRRTSEMASPVRNPCCDGSHGFRHAFGDSGECVCIPPRFGGATSAVTSAGVHRGEKASDYRRMPEDYSRSDSGHRISRDFLPGDPAVNICRNCLIRHLEFFCNKVFRTKSEHVLDTRV